MPRTKAPALVRERRCQRLGVDSVADCRKPRSCLESGGRCRLLDHQRFIEVKQQDALHGATIYSNRHRVDP